MRGKPFVIDKELLTELYVNGNKSMNLIAKELDVSIGKVYKDLKYYKIETRNQKETFTFKGHKLKDSDKKRISKTHKDKVVSKESREKISNAHKNIMKTKVENSNGYYTKFTKDGYVLVYKPNHPHANIHGYVKEHRIVMEQSLNRYLNSEEVIHHVNGDKSDNRIENLMLFKNGSEHIKYHAKLKKERG